MTAITRAVNKTVPVFLYGIPDTWSILQNKRILLTCVNVQSVILFLFSINDDIADELDLAIQQMTTITRMLMKQYRFFYVSYQVRYEVSFKVSEFF
jgi:hypothetical protein